MWQKTTKFCKAIIFQLKKINLKNLEEEKKNIQKDDRSEISISS